MAFGHWAGYKWKHSSRQLEALRIEAEKHGIPSGYSRRFSYGYESFSFWMARPLRTSTYQQRVINYMRRHPQATLKEARGHRRR